MYRRRTRAVEPLFDWFKSLFDVSDQPWHRGLDNNRTRILAALVVYQLLLRFNRRRGRINNEVQWILDAL